MSHHEDHDHDHGHGHDHRDRGGGAPDTQFLDLELSKVLFGEADSITREAFRELLKDAAKRRLLERWGQRITALAELAVDELIADAEANLEIEARIAARTQARAQLDDRVAAILAAAPSAAADTREPED